MATFTQSSPGYFLRRGEKAINRKKKLVSARRYVLMQEDMLDVLCIYIHVRWTLPAIPLPASQPATPQQRCSHMREQTSDDAPNKRELVFYYKSRYLVSAHKQDSINQSSQNLPRRSNTVTSDHPPPSPLTSFHPSCRIKTSPVASSYSPLSSLHLHLTSFLSLSLSSPPPHSYPVAQQSPATVPSKSRAPPARPTSDLHP